jgi:hypothetical protein
VSQPNPTLDDPNARITNASEKYFERISPWLLEVGSWIFGGLIAFDLIVIGPLITIGLTDRAITVATTAFALVLPLDVAGLFLLRMVRDMEHVEGELDLENEVRQVIQSVVPAVGEQAAASETLEARRKRRTWTTLSYSVGILTLCIVLTVAGMIAALWHLAWWIAVSFAGMVLICLVIVSLAQAQSRPPTSKEEREQRRRFTELITRQAKERSKKSGERA